MSASLRAWLALVVASGLVPANAAAAVTIARGKEGHQQQLKQDFAARLPEERAMTAEIEEVKVGVCTYPGFGEVAFG